jgi:hypothetical protein
VHQPAPQQPQPNLVLNQLPNQQPGSPIHIHLQPQEVVVNQPDAPRPPPIAAQGLTPPAAPAEEDLTSLVFSGEPPNLVTRCPVKHPVTWMTRQWKDGSIRPYYHHAGRRANFEECKQSCQARDDCYFVTLSPTKNCFFLLTTHTSTCGYEVSGHFGREVEKCTDAKPCQSAYKICGKPDCALQSIIQTYCNTLNKLKAVQQCTNSAVRR